ncbi:isoflavone reductase family protein [Purpureocillium lilacinum]|uniref:Isoflavone reductase family protein n=1 Tax=Purpureocillium lilacinum TaxID=33203 RepID=A0A179GBH9_PURLI|nr:isoflavone reductase family protein [Purpureocillium lilacinum]OAQ74761.1 isoflavone reductase family protein [Purpureocillium lilacinum]OAQ82871.1 isoflavone reductase family protein [Purpureocillium lilacinum]
MMRIAVAGGGGLGYLLASQLSQAANAYNVVVLSRFVRLPPPPPGLPPPLSLEAPLQPNSFARPEFQPFGIAVQVVDYGDLASLAFALQGVDLVLSTVTGRPQMNLIQAAARSRVRTFVPAEFEGSLSRRPSSSSSSSSSSDSSHCALPTDRASANCLALLRQLASQSRMRYTVFSCGMFMERLHPCGLGYFEAGRNAAADRPADFLVDISSATAEYPDRDPKGRSVRVCMSSIYDVARFVVAAVDLGPERWPHEFTMRGDRMTVRELVDTCSMARNVVFNHQVRSVSELRQLVAYHAHNGDTDRAAYYQRLVATALGRYDFSRANLNEAIDHSDHIEMQPLRLNQWLVTVCQSM